MALMESHFDFYQFRWLSCLAINQCLLLFAAEINPIHSLAVVAVVLTPLLNALQVKDLKKIDPYNSIIKSKKRGDDILPSGGLTTQSRKRISREALQGIVIEAAFGIAILAYLLRIKEDLTPDFLHFVFSLGEDATHKIWIFSIWFAYKCFLSVGATDLDLPDNIRLVVTYLQGFIGLILAEQASFKTLAIFTSLFFILAARLKYPNILNMTLVFFVGIYLS